MVAEIAREDMSPRNRAYLEARDALNALRAPRTKTDAERKLDEILQNLKSKKSDAAREAARRKIEQIKARLQALKLAAGSAAATGDPKLARKVAKDIRDAARELGKALNEAGAGSGAVPVAPSGTAAVAGGEAAGTDQQQGDPDAAAAGAQAGQQMQAVASGDDLANLKSEAAGILKELKKIMRKLRETSFHPGLEKKDRAEMEKMFSEAERELSGLQAASMPTAGSAVDVSV